jgi:putative phosphoesterase
MRIGLIGDTHLPAALTRLWDEVAVAFTGVDLVWHTGDIIRPSVLDELEEIAPTFAARGNNDVGWRDPRLALIQRLEVDGLRLAMVHDMEPEDDPIDVLLKTYLGGRHTDVLVSGHTHYERLDWRDGVLQINPGSPTIPHFTSTRLGTVGLLEIEAGIMRAEIVRLGESAGLRNPGVASAFDGHQVKRL